MQQGVVQRCRGCSMHGGVQQVKGSVTPLTIVCTVADLAFSASFTAAASCARSALGMPDGSSSCVKNRKGCLCIAEFAEEAAATTRGQHTRTSSLKSASSELLKPRSHSAKSGRSRSTAAGPLLHGLWHGWVPWVGTSSSVANWTLCFCCCGTGAAATSCTVLAHETMLV